MLLLFLPPTPISLLIPVMMDRSEKGTTVLGRETQESDTSRSVKCYRILWSAGTKGEVGAMGQYGGGYNTSSSAASILIFAERCITLCHISTPLSPLLAITQPYSSLFQIVGESSLVYDLPVSALCCSSCRQEEYLQEDSEDDYISTLETTLAALQNKV